MKQANMDTDVRTSGNRFRRILIPLLALLLLSALYFPFRFGFWTEVDNGFTAERTDGPAEPSLRGVPSLYEQPCEQPGSVVPFTYSAFRADDPSRTETRTLYVYLPFGYDPEDTDKSVSYNILYLLHGTGGSASSWLIDHPVNRNVVDNLIARGDIPPLLIVTPDIWEPESFGFADGPDRAQFARELRDQIIPAVESAFACATRSDPLRARTHRAIAGLSRGAQLVLEAGLADSLDLFDTFGTFSGMLTDPQTVLAGMEREDFRELPVAHLVAFNGFFDYTFYEHGFRMTMLDRMTDRITEGENYAFFLIEKGEHTWPSWEAALYNFLIFVY